MNANDLKPHTEYRDSGVPWLGTVPAHWVVRRLKTLTTVVDRRSVTGDEVLLSMRKYHGLVPYHEHFSKPPQAATLVGFKIVQPGHVVLNRMQAGFGLIFASNYHGLVSPDFGVFQLNGEVHPRYLEEFCRSHEVRAEFHRESKGLGTGKSGFMRLYDDRFGAIHIAFPPSLDEQQALLKFINSISRKVNRLIRNRRRLIAVLNEQKQAIINEAVTRGLRQGGRYKPSGSPWLGDIPHTWECKRLKNLAELRVSNVDKHTKDGEIPVRLCNYTDVYKNSVITADMPFMAATATPDEVSAFHIEVGDVIITKDSEDWQDIGVPALVAETADDLVCGYHLAILRPKPNVMSGRFLAYLMQCNGVSTQLSLAANGVTRYGLSHGAIKAISLPVAPFDEQKPLTDRIDDLTANLNKAIGQVNREIDLIHEYRIRLIADVVTGKLDVRHLTPPPGEAELDDINVIDAEETLDEPEGADEGDLAEEALNADD